MQLAKCQPHSRSGIAGKCVPEHACRQALGARRVNKVVVLPATFRVDFSRLEHLSVVVIQLPHAVAEIDEIVPNLFSRRSEIALQGERVDFDKQNKFLQSGEC